MPSPKKNTNRKTASDAAQSQGSGKGDAARPRPRRREIGAFVCLIMGIFTFLAYFETTGWLIQLLRAAITGLLGWGFYAVPFALLAIAAILIFHRGQPVILRVTSAALVPVLLGALLHLSLFGRVPGEGGLGDLWGSGQALESGGVLSGLLSNFLEAMVSRLGAAIVLFLLLGFLALLISNKGIADLVEWFKNRERRVYEPEPEPEFVESDPFQAPVAPMPPPTPPARRWPGSIDIPIDGEGAGARPVAETAKPGRRPIEFRGPGVASPDQFVEKEAPPAPAPPPQQLHLDMIPGQI